MSSSPNHRAPEALRLPESVSAPQRGLARPRASGVKQYAPLKRAFDVAVATGLLTLGIVPMVALMGVMAVDTRSWNPLFIDKRVGKDGRVFRMVKIKTMRKEFNKHGVRLTEDERTSRLAVWVRKKRFDETTQFFNVLKGDMSMVGPRPHRDTDWITQDKTRQSVKPGMTGLPQILGGNDLSLKGVLLHDKRYIRRLRYNKPLSNMFYDASILAATARTLATNSKSAHYRQSGNDLTR